MTESQFTFESWPVEGFQILPQELDQPFIAGDFPLVEELDPSLVEQSNVPKSNFQPYPALWYEAGLVRQDCATNQEPSYFPENTPTIDQLATQRALFMTPAYQFPASPTSDTRSSPDPASTWEEDTQAQYEYNFDYTLDQFQSPQFDSPQHAQLSEDCFTPLEMPDGSTRLTSNWLPVDPEAGFTIAAPEEEFQDMKFAFFPSEPTAWSYDR